MNTKPLPTKLLALLLGVGALSLITTAQAQAGSTAADSGSATYQCQGDYDAQPAATHVTFGLIGPPTSVRPGDALSLSGNLEVTLSSGDAQESQVLLAQNANLDATDFALVVTVGGRTIGLKPTAVVSTPGPIKSPFVLNADVSYPDLTLPSSATGSVVIRMPIRRLATDKVSGAPAKVTFTAHLNQDSVLVPGRNYACWADRLGSHATIARIPLQTPSSRGQAASRSSQGTSASSPAAVGANQGVGAPLLGGVNAPVSAGQSPTVQTAVANAPIPGATVSSKTFVPGWMLALLVALFPAAAIAFAIIQRRQVQRLRRQTTITH